MKCLQFTLYVFWRSKKLRENQNHCNNGDKSARCEMPSEWACHDFAGASITDKVCITCGVDEMNLRRQNCFSFWDPCNAMPFVGSPVSGHESWLWWISGVWQGKGRFFWLVLPRKVLSMELVPPNKEKITKFTEDSDIPTKKWKSKSELATP